MSALGQNHSPFISRPWFVALAMTLGATAMALGAYTVENPHAFTTKILRATPTPPPANVASKGELSPTTEPPKASPLVLEAVRITARPTRHHHAATNTNGCVPSWRELASGPAERQVREFCPATTLGTAPSK